MANAKEVPVGRVKRHAPAAARNRDPILAVLRTVLPETGRVLEIGSGTGEHAVHFARNLPGIEWQPSDVHPEWLASIEAWRADEGIGNMLPPLRLEVRDHDWGAANVVALVSINMIHIAPWECCEALFAGAARLLPAGAPLVLYGPFCFDGEFTAPSNAAFDEELRRRDPSWGVRDLTVVTRVARTAGFDRESVTAMPANNHTIVFRRVTPAR
jgi:cyclopropane fatty-acyl-phospholipid synthase-like methyltransferase